MNPETQQAPQTPLVAFVAGEFKGKVVDNYRIEPQRENLCDHCGQHIGKFRLAIGPVFSNRFVCSIICLDEYDKGIEFEGATT